MDLKIHHYNSISVAEIVKAGSLISDTDEIVDAMANAQYHNAGGLIVRKELLHDNFFDLKTGLAGEILQKFSNYRMRLAVIGDFSKYKSKSLKDFIRESNTMGRVVFVPTFEDAIEKLCGVKWGVDKLKG